MKLYKLFKSISEENKKYKLQIDTIEALKKQFRKEITIPYEKIAKIRLAIEF